MGELFGFIALIGLGVHFLRRDYDPKKAERDKRVQKIVRDTKRRNAQKRRNDATH